MRLCIITVIYIIAIQNSVFTAQPAFHMLATREVTAFSANQFDIERGLAAPVSGIASHMLVDRFVGESAIDYQVDIGIVRALIMWLATPDSKKDEFLWESFWGLFPDIYDKSTGSTVFHSGDRNIVPLSPGITNLGEEFSILLFEVKWQ